MVDERSGGCEPLTYDLVCAFVALASMSNPRSSCVQTRLPSRRITRAPLWPVERWQQRETVGDEFSAIGNQDLSTIGHHGSNSGQLVAVAGGDGLDSDLDLFVVLDHADPAGRVG